MSSFRKHTLVGARYAPGDRVKGIVSFDDPTPFDFRTSVQPLEGSEKISLPDEFKDRETYLLFTSFKLQTVNEKLNIKADIITLDEKSFQVIKVKPWQNKVIPHYACTVSMLDE